jgi:two-component system sensor histidine kinase SenX3
VDPDALVSVCVERATPLAVGKETVLEIVPPVGKRGPLRGDRELLEHALYNLITNAIKYSPGGTTVQVRQEQRDGALVLSVADQGMGMTPEEQRAVFRKFYRTEGAERSGEKGSGIGLSIVEQIVRAHRGRIELQSAPGVGSTFSLVLPCGKTSS